MERGVLRAYAAALTGLALAGAWLGVASRIDGEPAAPAAAPRAVAAGDAEVAHAYRTAAAMVAAGDARRARAVAAPPPPRVTAAPPVIATASS